MFRRSSVLFAATALGTPALSALPVGAVAPDFSTQGVHTVVCVRAEPGCAKGASVQRDFQFSLRDALKNGPVVLYFFPAAFTSGCTIETKAFADASDDFRRAGATLVGVSADPIAKLKLFHTETCRSKFPVAVASPAMIKDYKVQLPLMARSNRTSFVIAPTGKITYVLSEMKPDGHVSGTLAAVRALKR